MRHRFTLAVCGFVCLVGMQGIAKAQDTDVSSAEVPVLEQIIVTARRRTENLQQVPISVTVVDGDRIQPDMISSVSEVALETPNFTFTQFNVGEPEYFIRGIGNTNDSAGSDPAVGTFIDDVYIGRTGGTAMDLFDLERVEVLRGPQGTLFGKNVVGGAISIQTRKPSEDFRIKTSATLGNYNRRTFRGLVNGALSKNVAGKISVSTNLRDGYVKNTIDGKDYQDADHSSVRAQLLALPHESVEVLLGIDYAQDELEGNCRNVNNLALNDPLGLSVFYPGVISARTGGDIRKCASSIDAGQERDVGGMFVRVDWQLETAKFSSITAYREADYSWAEDLAGLPLGETPFNLVDQASEKSHQLSQEIRLVSSAGSQLDWLVGAFYMREDIDRSENFIGSFAAPLAAQGFSLLDGNVSFLQDNQTDSVAVFGKVDWAVTDKLTISAGLRWARDEKSIDQALTSQEDPAGDIGLLSFLGNPNPAVVLGIPANGPDDLFAYLATANTDFLRTPYATKADDSWSEFLPSLNIDWWFAQDAMAYAAVSRGYKSGAFQSQTTTAGAAGTPLAPELATSYEVGIKSELWQNRIRLNAAVFKIDYTDLQVFQLVGSLLVGGNAEATNKGFELDLAALLTPDLSIAATVGIQDPEYDVYTLGTQNFSGNRLPRASKRSWSVHLDYSRPFQDGSEVNVQARYAHKSDFYFDPSNASAALQDGYGIANLRVAWRKANWGVSLWGKNLADKEVRINTFISNIAGTVDLWNEPRTYGLTLSYERRD